MSKVVIFYHSKNRSMSQHSHKSDRPSPVHTILTSSCVFFMSPIRAVGLCSVSALPALTCSKSPKSPRCASKPKTKKIMYDTAENDDFDREQIATYEEVAKLYPRPGIYRPIVLIGAPGVGRNELKRRLIDTDPDKYRTPTPCKFYCY